MTIGERCRSEKTRAIPLRGFAIAAERIRSGTADHKEDGVEALAKLGIEIPAEE
jgi:hypothetical protein